MTLNGIHIFIFTGSFLYWCVMRPASQHFFIHSCIYLRLLILSYLATFLGTNSLSVLMCRKAVNQLIVWLFSFSFLSILNGNVSTLAEITFLAWSYKIQDRARRHSDLQDNRWHFLPFDQNWWTMRSHCDGKELTAIKIQWWISSTWIDEPQFKLTIFIIVF